MPITWHPIRTPLIFRDNLIGSTGTNNLGPRAEVLKGGNTVTSCNTLDHADSSHTVHMTFRTWHRLPVAPGHLGPIPHAWNLSLRFVSLFGPLPYVHFLSHLCLYVT